MKRPTNAHNETYKHWVVRWTGGKNWGCQHAHPTGTHIHKDKVKWACVSWLSSAANVCVCVREREREREVSVARVVGVGGDRIDCSSISLAARDMLLPADRKMRQQISTSHWGLGREIVLHFCKIKADTWRWRVRGCTEGIQHNWSSSNSSNALVWKMSRMLGLLVVEYLVEYRVTH